HRVVELPFFKEFTKTSLVNREVEVPLGVDCNISDYKTSMKTAKLVWVPNRNGIFINVAAGFAEGLGASCVIVGFNAEEGTTFPDNTQEFLTSLDQSLTYSTATQIKVKSYTTKKNKTEIVHRGTELNAPFNLMWPCYDSASEKCGQCESCLRFQRALDDALKFRPLRDLEI
ncbi:MAG: 7-cyano-7-deazaguanine synthase, partial [Pseudomonadota bacterium]|nr:7-cyano-7-deazaguanine synthase [Pseudomonadota bacterium]